MSEPSQASTSEEVHKISVPEEAIEVIEEGMKEWVKDHPNEGLFECIEEFGIRRLGDALAKVLYNYPFPDFIITYSDSDLKEGSQPIRQKRNQRRRNFERLLLKTGLIIEQEQDAASENVYIKLYAPFEKLCEQAEVIKLRMRLDTTNMKELKELEE
ncbi:hypothetical protein C2G38_2137212 [Gigaspora rosea]|uniref:Anoctamin dimerisation domain-containing protein n=1 Tax=Gigaspora rosea TaxID=44941 RepID=A0A397W1S4_9GLOM|nr:hypothetical protein C2G38_2137212 [Gigaspora rosea]